MKKFLFLLIQCTWGILQTFIGAILFLCFAHKVSKCDYYKYAIELTITNTTLTGAVSLGAFVFYFYNEPDLNTQRHEFGHCIQSMILGPLYLFVVGIPSVVWALYSNKHENTSYYSFYTEKWADKLVGVNRGNRE